MSTRILVASVAALALLAPSGAHALGLTPRLGFAMVIEDGPPGTDAKAYGQEFSLGLGVGVPLLSVVADLGFRKASVSSSGLEDGWTEYATRDTAFTLGVRSQLTVLPKVRVAGELHGGTSWADHRAEAEEPVAHLAPWGGEYFLYGGAGEVRYLVTRGFSLGLRVGVDRFEPYDARDDEGARFGADFRRTSYTAGLLLGIGG